jgi:hypothetical protein
MADEHWVKNKDSGLKLDYNFKRKLKWWFKIVEPFEKLGIHFIGSGRTFIVDKATLTFRGKSLLVNLCRLMNVGR